MLLLYLFCFGLILSIFSQHEKVEIRNVIDPSYHFVHGSWFTGKDFKQEDFYSVNGILTSKKPAHIDSIIDLKGKYIVPPFAEAHTHNIGASPSANEIKPYIKNGIFYVMVQSNTYPIRENQTIDYPVEITEAAALLTPSGSHITIINERSADRGNFPGVTKEQLDGKTHILINHKDDLKKLDAVLDTKPSFIKLIIAFSEEHDKRKNDTAFIGKRGLDPAIIKLVTEKAHKKGVWVSAHIETAADFRLAVNSGIDIIAHLPGNRLGADAGFADTTMNRWMLTEQDAEAAVKKGVTVITTVTGGKTLLNPSRQGYAAARNIRTHNLQLLYSKKVKLAIGSDYYEGNSLVEILLLGKQPLLGGNIQSLGIFDNLTLLQLWCMQTPQFIFPKRKIGELREGYEASFLVLNGDPVSDLKYVTKIDLRIKRGRIIFSE